MDKPTVTHVTPCEAFKAFKTYALIIISLAGVVFLFTWGVMTGLGGLLWNKIESLDARGIENKTNIATLTTKLDERFVSFENKLNSLQTGQVELKVMVQEHMKEGRAASRPPGAMVAPSPDTKLAAIQQAPAVK